MNRCNDEEENVTLPYRTEKPTDKGDKIVVGEKVVMFMIWLVVCVLGFIVLAWFLAGCIDDGIQQADNETYKVAHRGWRQ